jgi:hypothetical protein
MKPTRSTPPSSALPTRHELMSFILHGRCVTCGASAYDWRRLVGVGARVAARSVNPASVLLTYPGACGNCGASELVVAALAPAADRRAGPLRSEAGDAAPARGTRHA